MMEKLHDFIIQKILGFAADSMAAQSTRLKVGISSLLVTLAVKIGAQIGLAVLPPYVTTFLPQLADFMTNVVLGAGGALIAAYTARPAAPGTATPPAPPALPDPKVE